MNGAVTIRQGSIADLGRIVPLFDAYRQFYGQPSNAEVARRYLADRLERKQSMLLIALLNVRVVGFCQLYPSFSSIALVPTFILNDLYVVPEARGCGTGLALLDAACEFGRHAGAARLTLSTATENAEARALYEKSGWQRVIGYCDYAFALI